MTSELIVPTARANRMTTWDWRRDYSLRLFITDGLALVWVVFGTQLFWLGLEPRPAVLDGISINVNVSYSVVSLGIILLWMLALHMYGTRDYRVLGVGVAEFKNIVDSSGRLFGLLAIVAFLTKADVARGYILIALPAGVLTLLVSRWMWRQWLGVQRSTGRFSSRVILVGSQEAVAQIADEFARQPRAGYHVVGACLAGGPPTRRLGSMDIEVLGGTEAVMAAVAAKGADTVVIASADDLPPNRVRELSWSLEPGRQHLVVAPSLTDIGGPRIHLRPVAGLPLVHVETPRYSGGRLLSKRVFDVLISTGLIVVLSPALAIIALLVIATTRGPALFKQDRVGLNGQTFRMLKFRSMVADAETQLAKLAGDDRDAGNAIMFKMKSDPRVTPVGRVLRRFSLDELPQLFNVLGGSMSLVGPRPPLAREVSAYESHVHRRFLVKPGITGLWQVSGRSDLSWEDTVRLDLFYVENWSMSVDFGILWRTLKAVLGSNGAY